MTAIRFFLEVDFKHCYQDEIVIGCQTNTSEEPCTASKDE